MNFRCKSDSGSHVLKGIDPSMPWKDFQVEIEKVTNIQPANQKIKAGYPPALVSPECAETTLANLNFKTGESFVVEALAGAGSKSNAPVSTTKSSAPWPSESEGVIVRRVIDSDNSCLFNAIGYVLLGKERHQAPQLRRIIADTVDADPITYSDALLGKPNREYQEWILNKQHWGGGIELSILSRYFEKEICALDTQTVRVDRFGEDANYKERVFVIYDGIHYDAIAVASSSSAPESKDKTVFSADDQLTFSKAVSFLDAANMQHQYTDLAGFQLRCMDCDAKLKGQTQAQQHAQQTGHTNFGELS
eukprot:Nk52_evm19s276 gene=Nk52_evmTU19s276